MGNNGYSYDELTTPFVSKFRKRMQRQLGKVAKVLIEALQANEVKDFAHQGVVVDRRTYIDHRTRLKAGEDIVKFGGAEPAKKIESKHEHEGTIHHDLTERLEQAIEATEDAIRGKGSRSGKKT